MLTKIITSSTLPQAKRVELNEKFSSYITGVNTLTSADLEEIRSASAAGRYKDTPKLELRVM